KRRWEIAKYEYLNTLEPAEREIIEELNPENLERSINQHMALSGLQQRINIFEKTKISKVVDFMEKFGGAADVYSNIQPEILCLIWGSVRVVLKVMFLVISNSLPLAN